MYIYTNDPISEALGVRPISQVCPGFDPYNVEIPDDAQNGGWNFQPTPKGSTQHPEHVKARMESMDYEKVSKTLKNRYKNQPHHSLGRKNGPPSEETKRKISESNKGRKKDNSSGKMGQHWKGKPSPQRIEYYCVGCHERVAPSRINRHGKCFEKFCTT